MSDGVRVRFYNRNALNFGNHDSKNSQTEDEEDVFVTFSADEKGTTEIEVALEADESEHEQLHPISSSLPNSTDHLFKRLHGARPHYEKTGSTRTLHGSFSGEPSTSLKLATRGESLVVGLSPSSSSKQLGAKFSTVGELSPRPSSKNMPVLPSKPVSSMSSTASTSFNNRDCSARFVAAKRRDRERTIPLETGKAAGPLRSVPESISTPTTPTNNIDMVLPLSSDVEVLKGSFHDDYLRFARRAIERCSELSRKRYLLASTSTLTVSFFVLPGFLSGLLFGVYISFVLFFCICVSEPIRQLEIPESQVEETEDLLKGNRAKSVEENDVKRVYKGWMNILNERYHPHTFHVNTLQTVLVRLDGNMLRISRPDRSLLKHAFHTDPTLTEPEPRMISQNIYDLTNATIKLRPRRLARRRWFSRKYPIYVRLASGGEHQRYTLSRIGTPERTGSSTSRAGSAANTPGTPMMPYGKGVLYSSNSSLGSEREPSKKSMASNDEELAQEAQSMMSDESSDESLEDELAISHSISDFVINGAHQHHQCTGTSIVAMNRRRPTSLFSTSSACRRSTTRHLYLFSRSAREKEQWFHRLRKACSRCSVEKGYDSSKGAQKRRTSAPTLDTYLLNGSSEYFLYILHNLQFSKNIEELLPDTTWSRASSESVGDLIYMDLGRCKWQQPHGESSSEFNVIVNLVASRIFYDFCRDEYWCRAVQKKIQTKLATIHLPYFIETLELSNFEIGTAIPRIHNVYAATVNEWGTWIDFEVYYVGQIKLVIETKVNLMKLKEQSDDLLAKAATSDSASVSTAATSRRSALTPQMGRYSDDELPESPETSPDEEFGTRMKADTEPSSTRKKTGKKLLSLVDRLTHSRYFKEASELKPIRKMMEEISSTRLILNVEVTQLEGVMTINLPSPPSDRLWYGFRKPPKMSVKAVPQVGDRSVVISTLSDWIESKIVLLLEKSLVVPNLDDVVIPVLSGNKLLHGPLNL